MMLLVSPRITAATTRRVLAQLRGDRRTVALMLVVPSVLLVLVDQMFDSRLLFDRVALQLLGIFPFTIMFLITSVAMLRERTGGTLERLLTTPTSKLDLLLGYGIAFALAAAAQAAVTCATAYWLLGLYAPGSPWMVVGVAIASAVLGTALGLLGSAFATTEFQAVQLMPAVVLPQVLLGGLFVPRAQMAGWLQKVSDALPLSYSIEALGEVGRTAILTDKLLRDTGVVIGSAILALALAASTLRRSAGPLKRSTRRALLVIPLVTVVASGVLVAMYFVSANRYVWTNNAQIDGNKIPVIAPATGTLMDWEITQGSTMRKEQPIGSIEVRGGFYTPSQRVIRAPADGTVVVNKGVNGAFVTSGTQLAAAYDLSKVFVTARVDGTAIRDVHLDHPVDIAVDAYPDTTFTGYVWQIQDSTAQIFSRFPPDNTTGNFQKLTQFIPVKIGIINPRHLDLVPGMSVTVNIHKH